MNGGSEDHTPEQLIATLRHRIVELERRIEEIRDDDRQIQEREARCQAVIESLEQGIVFQDDKGKVFAANPAAEQILGLTEEQMTGRTSVDPRWRAIREDGTDFRGEDHPAMAALKTGQEQHGVIMGIYNPMRDEHRWILVDAVPLRREPTAAPHEVYSTFADITLARASEAARKQSEARLANVVRASPMGIHMYSLRDDRLIFTGANPAADRILRVDNSAYVGKPLEEAFPGLAEGEVPRRYRRAATEGEMWTTDQIVYDEGRIAGAFQVHAFQTGDNEMATMFLDVTERMRAEVSLRRSEMRYRALFEAATDGIFVIGDQEIMDCNPAALAVFKRSREELLGEGGAIPDQEPFPEQMLRRLAEIDSANQPVFFEWKGTKGDGSPLEAEVSVTDVDLPDGDLRLVIVRDMTARRRAERENKSLEAQLRHQQKLESIGTLASGVAHEINNPLNGIMNYAQLLANRLSGEEPLQRFAHRIVEESERVSEIVGNLLTFARQERQTHSPARMVDIVRAAITLIGAVLRRDQIGIDIDVDGALPSVRCRSQQIQQVLLNLLTNARDALNERFPGYHEDKRVSIQCRLLETGGGAKIVRTTVSDNGAGIESYVQDRIFDPFYTTKSRNLGTGLGLSVSYALVKEHGGLLWLEHSSSPTRFHMDLPIPEDPDKERG